MARRGTGSAARAAVAAALVAACAAAGCGHTSAPSTPAPQHPTFTYTGIANPAQGVWHPGETITVTVTPQPGPATSDASPATVSLSLAMNGPFVSVDALKQAVAGAATGRPFAPPIGLRTPPVTTDTWSGQTLTGSLALPPTVRPGYYSLRETVRRTDAHGSVTGAGDMVLRVTP